MGFLCRSVNLCVILLLLLDLLVWLLLSVCIDCGLFGFIVCCWLGWVILIVLIALVSLCFSFNLV